MDTIPITSETEIHAKKVSLSDVYSLVPIPVCPNSSPTSSPKEPLVRRSTLDSATERAER